MAPSDAKLTMFENNKEDMLDRVQPPSEMGFFRTSLSPETADGNQYPTHE